MRKAGAGREGGGEVKDGRGAEGRREGWDEGGEERCGMYGMGRRSEGRKGEVRAAMGWGAEVRYRRQWRGVEER